MFRIIEHAHPYLGTSLNVRIGVGNFRKLTQQNRAKEFHKVTNLRSRTLKIEPGLFVKDKVSAQDTF